MLRALAAFLLLGAAVSATPPQLPIAVEPTLTLRGRVIADSNDAALRRVRVAASSGTRRMDPVFTDDEGRFAVGVPTRAPVTVTAAKAGYARVSLSVPAAQINGELILRLPRGAAIAGRIIDTAGAPVAEVGVALRPVDSSADHAEHLTTTDDLGQYRIGGLTAGRYLVFITPGPLSSEDLALTASGALTIARLLQESGQRIDVTAGETVAAADIVMADRPSRAASRALLVAQGLPDRLVPCGGTAILRVRVVTPAGQPVVGASVNVSTRRTSAANDKVSTVLYSTNDVTDATGHALVDCLPAAAYTIRVSKAGQTVAQYGDRRAVSTSASVQDGEVIDVGPVVMQRIAAATGIVTDEHGEPLEGVVVQPLEVRYAHGRSSAMPVGRPRRTDDRGQFRIYGLPPGRYLLSARVDAVLRRGGEQRPDYAITFYPGTADISFARELQVGNTADITGIDIVFTPATVASVSGVAVDAAGNPFAGRVQLLVRQRAGGITPEPMEAPIGADGRFAITNVPPGDYVVHAIRPPAVGFRPESGAAYVSVVDGDPAPVTIRTSEGHTVSGRVTVENRGGKTLSALEVSAFLVDFDRAPWPEQSRGIVLSGDGTFYFSRVHGAIRIAVTSAPDDWYLKSVRLGAVDLTAAAFDPGGDLDDVEMVVSANGASLSGRSTDARRLDEYVVILFAADPEAWGPHSRYVRLARSSPDGSFRIRGVAPGDYLIAALESADVRVDTGSWEDPEFLRRIRPTASRVTLEEGEHRTLTLRVASP